MNSKRLEIFARREPFLMNRVDVLIFERSQLDGVVSIAVAQPVVMKTLVGEEQYLRNEPTFSLPPETAQQLMDELWRSGLRPTEGSGSAGALAATEKTSRRYAAPGV